MSRPLRLSAGIALVLSAQSAGAQQTFTTCDPRNALTESGTGLCMGWSVVQQSAGPGGLVKINVWNASAEGVNGRINSFGFWNIGTALSLTTLKYFDGSTLNAVASNGDWTNGPVSGFGISGFSAAAGISNQSGDGFTSDPVPAGTSCFLIGRGGDNPQDCWVTSASKYLEFTFEGNVAANLSGVEVGFRAQNTGSIRTGDGDDDGDDLGDDDGDDDRAEGSFKCGVGLSVNCVTTPGGPPVTTVPEPSTYALMGMGLAVLGMVRRRRGSVER